MTETPKTSELAREKTRESILAYARHVNQQMPRHIPIMKSPGRNLREAGRVQATLDEWCALSDAFERTSIELMYAQRGGNLADLPW